MSISTTVTDTDKNFIEHETQRMNMALRSMSEGILNDAKNIAPILTGALRQSGRLKVKKNEVDVIFGGGDVPYAKIRHYVNHKNPQTLRYLERAGNARTQQGLERYI